MGSCGDPALHPQRYLLARKQHRRKIRAWKQQLDALEDQHEQLTLGAGVGTASVSVSVR